MTDETNQAPADAGAASAPTAHDLAENETPTVIAPPPVPLRKPGFFQRLFTSRKKQQALAVQNGYLEMLDLIRAIRLHLDRQETVQTTVLALLEKVPSAMDRQNDVMTLFKQQLEHNLEKDRQLTESMGKLNQTLAGIDESQRASTHTVTDLISRSRESEQLLREVMKRAEHRMTLLLLLFFVLAVGGAIYFFRSIQPLTRQPLPPPAPAAVESVTEPAPAVEAAPAAEPAQPSAVEPAPAVEPVPEPQVEPAPEPVAEPVVEPLPPAPPAPAAETVAEPSAVPDSADGDVDADAVSAPDLAEAAPDTAAVPAEAEDLVPFAPMPAPASSAEEAPAPAPDVEPVAESAIDPVAVAEPTEPSVVPNAVADAEPEPVVEVVAQPELPVEAEPEAVPEPVASQEEGPAVEASAGESVKEPAPAPKPRKKSGKGKKTPAPEPVAKPADEPAAAEPATGLDDVSVDAPADVPAAPESVSPDAPEPAATDEAAQAAAAELFLTARLIGMGDAVCPAPAASAP